MGARLAAVLLALATGCGFDSRSGQFECGAGESCDDGRVCMNGWCVVEGSEPEIDADVGPFTCNDFECRLVCGAGECAEVTCPAGRPCTVECSGDGACSDLVDCDGASSCQILCTGPGACGGEVECGGGPCVVECSGDGSCAGGVDCSAACSCEVDCEGTDSCQGSNACARPQQCQEGNECITTGGPCDQC